MSCVCVRASSPDAISICESKLQHTIDDSSIQIDGYLIHRLVRNCHGGGVILYIKASLNAMDVQKLRPKDTAHEYFWVRFTSNSRPVYICSLYRPPSADSSVFDSLSKNLAHIQSLKKDALVLLLGDFNTHNNEWLGSLNGLGRPTTNDAGTSCEALCISHGLSQMVSFPTHDFAPPPGA